MRLAAVLVSTCLSGCVRLAVPVPPTKPAPPVAAEDLRGWVAVPPPVDAEVRSANRQWDDAWVVRATEGEVRIYPWSWRQEEAAPMPPTPRLPAALPSPSNGMRRHVVEHGDLLLVGDDHGEHGGGLRLYARDGVERADFLLLNTRGMFPRGDEVVTLHGLNHLDCREGEVRGWRWAGGGLEPVFSHGLDGGPCSHVVVGEEVLFNTPTSLWKVAGHEVVHLHRFAADACGSVAVDARGDVWIGMTAYVLHLMKGDDGAFTEEWLARRVLLGRWR